MAESESVPFWWIVLLPIPALGSGAAVIFSVDGSFISGVVAFPLSF